MDKEYDIMIFNALLIRLHLKLVMKNKPENSLLNVFINYFKSSCDWKVNNSTRTNLLILAISFYVVIISNVMRVFNLWVFDKTFINVFFKVYFSKKLFVYKHSLEAIRYVALSFTVVNSEWSIDTNFITLFLIGSVGTEHEDIFL